MPSYKGKFKPINPDKYAGDPNNIVYRSFLEYKVMARLDTHSEIVTWASEELAIPYRNPVTRKQSRYFPDLWFEKTNGEKWLVEIKPLVQCSKPVLKEGVKDKRKLRRFRKEMLTFAVNKAKWQAAEALCKKHGWKWKILTDKEINGK